MCLIDEAAYVPKQIIDDVIFPMTIVEQGFEVGKKVDQNAISNNKILMASSAHYRSNHLYETYIDWTKKMLKDGNREFFTMTLPYTVGVRAGFMKQSKIDERKANMSETSFATEYLGIFPKLMDGIWIKPDDYLKCKNITSIETEGSSKYEYVMSVDVARVKGQDNTIIMVFKLHWLANHVEADLVYIKGLNGCPFSQQAREVREVLHRFPTVIRIYMDTMTIGQGLTDELAKEYVNDYTETKEPPLIDMNDEIAMKNRDLTKGIPLIYGIKATAEINHRCGYAIKVWTEKGWLHLYTENAGDDDHMVSKSEFSAEELNVLRENKATEDEVLSMEAVNLSSGYMKFTPRGVLKDRWSALGYGLYGINIIKKERDEKNKRGNVLFAVHRR